MKKNSFRIKVQNKGRESSIGKCWLLLFFAFFTLGILYVNLCEVGENLTYLISSFRYYGFSTEELLVDCLQKRLTDLCFLLIMAAIHRGRSGTFLFVAWQGFSLGGTLCMFILSRGISGVLTAFAALMPQYLFYIPFYFGIMVKCLGHDKTYERHLFLRHFLLYILLTILFVGGIITEVYVNPVILSQILGT